MQVQVLGQSMMIYIQQQFMQATPGGGRVCWRQPTTAYPVVKDTCAAVLSVHFDKSW